MKNKVVGFESLQGLKAGHRKEKSFYKQLSVIEGNEVVIEARFYETASRIYCCLWVMGEFNRFHSCQCNGSGFTSGYGYDRESAALGEAISSAGIELEQSIHGVGSTAMNGALVAIAERIGCEDPWVAVAHG